MKFLGFGELGKSQIKLQVFSERGRIAESMGMGMRMLYQDMRIPHQRSSPVPEEEALRDEFYRKMEVRTVQVNRLDRYVLSSSLKADA